MYLTGETIKGYELLEVIGRGGYGVVYKGQHAQHGEVAVKVILKDDFPDAVALKRFELEAQLIDELNHPHIVDQLAYWTDDRGAFLVMPLLNGGNLRTSMRAGGVWSPERALTLMEQIIDALETAHQRHIIHRDIKPENILFDRQGQAYLVDFGLAKRLNIESGLTGKHSMIGSPSYLAPEHMLNLPVTQSTDIYCLGIILYEMMIGEHPFENAGSEIQMMMMHLREPLPKMHEKNPNLTVAIDAVVRKAAAKEASDRHASAGALLEDFRAAVNA